MNTLGKQISINKNFSTEPQVKTSSFTPSIKDSSIPKLEKSGIYLRPAKRVIKKDWINL